MNPCGFSAGRNPLKTSDRDEFALCARVLLNCGCKNGAQYDLRI